MWTQNTFGLFLHFCAISFSYIRMARRNNLATSFLSSCSDLLMGKLSGSFHAGFLDDFCFGTNLFLKSMTSAVLLLAVATYCSFQFDSVMCILMASKSVLRTDTFLLVWSNPDNSWIWNKLHYYGHFSLVEHGALPLHDLIREDQVNKWGLVVATSAWVFLVMLM